jgi:hypothetical protein
MTNSEPQKPQEPQQGNPWLNIVKIILLIAGLIAAWYVLERLLGSK